MKTQIGIWIAQGLLNRADAILLFTELVECSEIRMERQEIVHALVEDVSLLCSNCVRSSLPYNRAPAHYLWIACQRMNIITEYFSYEEQETLLFALQMAKFPKLPVDKRLQY